jgi:hypothetical protein
MWLEVLSAALLLFPWSFLVLPLVLRWWRRRVVKEVR